MPIEDDQSSDGNLPQLPDLPGLEELDRRSASAPAAKPSVDAMSFPDPAHPGLLPLSFGAEDIPAAADDSDSGGVVGIQTTADSDPYLGRSFGGYRLEERIGQGGMGTVYKGRQVSLDRIVAVKILNKALYENREFIKRFEREAKSIARINHPNIVAVYDFGVHEGLWYMVNEFIEGQSLSKIISDRLVVPIHEVATYMIHCLAGLAHVEQGSIVHRDIKPDNILVTKDGIAKVADFGLAKDVSERNDTTDLTAAGLAMGTPAYMSPEQCMGRKLDGRSDQYSLGVTAYFALTGHKPFTGQSSFEIMTRQREYLPPPPNTLNRTISGDISALVMRMLAKDPADRFPDANTCRDTWVQIGTALGFLSATRRSGEFEAPTGLLGASVGDPRKSSRLRSDPSIPAPSAISPGLAPLPLDQPSRLALESLPPAPAIPGSRRPATDGPNAAGASGSGPMLTRTSGEWQPDRVSAGVGSERHRSAASVTCPRCGHLNRAETLSCSKCSAQLREGPVVSQRDQEQEAQRLFDQGRHREAAVIYARLADKETDKRARSILRAKERESRKVETERQQAEVLSKAASLRERGSIDEAIAMLEQYQRQSADSPAVATSSSGSDMGVAAQIASLRGMQAARRRHKVLVLSLLVLGLGLISVVALLWHLGLIALPGAPAVATPAESGAIAP